jgi:hypothetical protein
MDRFAIEMLCGFWVKERSVDSQNKKYVMVYTNGAVYDSWSSSVGLWLIEESTWHTCIFSSWQERRLFIYWTDE